MSVFTKDAGRILDPKETQAMTGAYRERKLNVGLRPTEYVRSEFFGIDQVQNLLNQPGCVGLRVHHAKRWEDKKGNPTSEGEGQLKPRVLLTAVDAKGNNLPIYSDNAGMKDMPVRTGGMMALADGPVCPPHCGETDTN
ncbi:hypothetical protein [Spirosoma validum]|uniref:Uncharacterized protein n=1 Tax=Spirosoma validum TaxID=2771355 RepID=A0A927B2T2_9BACT|nr:hypothetical protein [Spirosoma validum]MBD2754534.1 hypothetical protein [Spirosoma validum]